jgi:hypothetical protein
MDSPVEPGDDGSFYMISSTEALAGLYGALRLARADPNGMRWFNTSAEGFWRSFWAAALVAPMFALLLWIRYEAEGLTVPPLRFALLEFVSYVVAWTLFPLLMFYVVQVIERERQYYSYMVAYNWSTVWQNVVYLPLAMVSELGVLPFPAAATLSVAVLAAVFVYIWFITKTALQVNALVAGGVVAVDFLISIFLNILTDGLIHTR